jgi:hypothetical protein
MGAVSCTAPGIMLHLQCISAKTSTYNADVTTPTSMTAIEAITKALSVIESVQVLDGTDKDSVEHLLRLALEKLAANTSHA